MPADLNCGGCVQCCIGDTITLQPGDDPKRYKTELRNGKRVLRKGIDGNCVYLTPTGCGIHGSAPTECQKFDCRVYAMGVRGLSWQARAARLTHHLRGPVIKRGEALLAEEGR